jgi:2-methylcitrate dehydratase PrpD
MSATTEQRGDDSLERILSRHVVESARRGLPDEVLRPAARQIAWAVGTGIGGSASEGSDQIARAGVALGGDGPARIWNSEATTSALGAALVNGAYAKALEFEDKYWVDAGHSFGIGPMAVPAAFAVAQTLGRPVSGRELTTAVALAADVQSRLLRSTPRSLVSPWNGTYLHGNFAAVVAAACLYGLDEEEMMNAFGMVYAQLAGNWQSQLDPSLGVRMQAGYSARNGVTAARLAREGVTGTHQFLDGRFGFYNAFLPDNDRAALTAELGTRYWGTTVAFKGWPCGAVAHPGLEAIERMLKARPDLEPDAVVAIEVTGTTRMEIMTEPRAERWNPTTHIGAEFSAPWVFAYTLVHGRLDLRYSSDEALADARVRAVVPRVSITLDRPADEGVTVRLRLADGAELSETVTEANGHPTRPLSDTDLLERFRMCLEFGRPEAEAAAVDALWQELLDLPALDDCRELLARV